ncbi:tripartite tricarboxylate transporter TctB family protein [Thermodesulfobacteriota bacterium]
MNGDRLSSLFLLLFGLFISKESFKLDIGDLHQPGPGFFLLFGGILLVGFSTILMLQSFLATLEKTESKAPEEKQNFRAVVYCVISLIVYALLFDWMGYILCTFFLVIFLQMLFDHKKWLGMLFTAGIVSLASYIIFAFLIKSELPTGILGVFF